MQKALISLTVLCLVQLSYAALPHRQFDEPLKTDFQMWHDNCEIYIPGVTQEEINRVRQGHFDTNNQAIKNYGACVWLESKVINLDMVMNKALLDIYMPRKIMEDEYIGYLLCAKENRERKVPFADKIWGLLQCNYKRNPNDFIFL
ncbi:uncharacterized protein LOC114336479 [Diabrotica virgifera virgifera]|uniref:Uncharacterized protein LOC114336479 n=1 Tax=Diabrotica virgifera virgifera TaxID=50390 RepID=A0A6P7G159_DIAVI|nr:uncharacterized protein LOC114336479 [Diabrotica virgifera virgifera]